MLNPYSNFHNEYELNGPPADPRFAGGDLKEALMEVINSPRFSLLDIHSRFDVILDIYEKYDPDNF